MLVITRTNIKLAGMNPQDKFRFTPLEYSITTNEVSFECVGYTETGRLFLGGDDGNLYELKHSSSVLSSQTSYRNQRLTGNFADTVLPRFILNQSGWTVKQICIDSTRNLLFSLSSAIRKSGRHQITVYDLGIDGTSFKRVATLTSEALFARIRRENSKLSLIEADRLGITYISQVTKIHSLEYHLVALLRCGVRIYFAFNENDWNAGNYTLEVKFPPVGVVESGESQNASLGIDIAPLNNGHYSANGTFFIIEEFTNHSKLLSISQSLPRIALLQAEKSKILLEPEETVSSIPIGSENRVLCVADTPIQREMDLNNAALCNYVEREDKRPLAPTVSLRSELGVSIKCLSSLSNFLYIPPYRYLILTNTELFIFLHRRPVDFVYEALEKNDINTVEILARQYGMLHLYSMLLAISTVDFPIVSETGCIYHEVIDLIKLKARDLLNQIGLIKTEDHPLNSYLPEDNRMNIIEYKGYYILFSRIIRPIWYEHIVYVKTEHKLHNQFSPEQLSFVVKKLTLLIDEWVKLELDVSCPDPLANLYYLALRTRDCLKLMALVSEDYSFRRVLSQLPANDIYFLKVSTFRDLISTHKGTLLIKSLSEGYIASLRQPKTTRSKLIPLTECLQTLRVTSPSLFTIADFQVYVGENYLKKATQAIDELTKEKYIELAVKNLFKYPQAVNMPRVVTILKNIGYYAAIVRLCHERSIVSKGIEEFKGESYCSIFNVLDEIHASIVSRKFSGHTEELIAKRHLILKECGKINDEHLSFAVFTWMIEAGLANEIINLHSIHIRPFIEKTFTKTKFPESDLLARYSMKTHEFYTAYMEYSKLASLIQTKLSRVLPIEERVSYLDLADKALSQINRSTEDINFETEKLAWLKQTARVQLRVKNEILRRIETTSQRYRLMYQDAADALDLKLYQLSDLYTEFTHPLELYEQTLEIYHYNRTRSIEQFYEETAMKQLIPFIIEYYSTAEWPAEISRKLQDIGLKYAYAIDCSSIINSCEMVNLERSVEENWLIQSLLSLDIPEGIAEIWEIYYELWNEFSGNPDYCWILGLRMTFLLREWFAGVNQNLLKITQWSIFRAANKTPNSDFLIKIQLIEEFFKYVFSVLTILPVDRNDRLLREFEELYRTFQGIKENLPRQFTQKFN